MYEIESATVRRGPHHPHPRAAVVKDRLRAAVGLLSGRLPGGDFVLYVAGVRGDLDRHFYDGIEELCGFPPGAFEDAPDLWISRIHPEDRDRVVATLGAVGERDLLTLDYRVVTRDDEVRWVRDHLHVMRLPRGRDEIVGLLRDVTRERELRAEVAILEDRLWQSQRMESVGALAGGIAHDFNNLLTAILSSAELLRDELTGSPEGLRDLGLIEDAARRGAALVRQILTFAARSAYRAGPLDAGRVVDDLRPILERTLGEQVSLQVSRSEDLWEIQGDLARVEQVILNLAVNARDAMTAGGTLRIDVSNAVLDRPRRLQGDSLEPGRYVRITVADTGTGIPRELRPHIFEPFFTTKQGIRSGAGLGLSTVRRIVRSLGGGVEVESEVGEGSDFRVWLPVRSVAEALVPEAQATLMAGETPGARILVVEDEPTVRAIVERSLSRDGHMVVSVGSAAEGLRVFDRMRPPFDLLVADVVLPDRSGPELHRALRRRVPDLPVIFMSGYGEEIASLRAAMPPDTIFLPKPFPPSTLRQRVREALLRPRGEAADPGSALGS